LKSALLTPSEVIWRRFVIHRWIFSWTTSPLNPLAAGAGTFDSVLISGRSSSDAAAPGEIPGERRHYELFGYKAPRYATIFR